MKKTISILGSTGSIGLNTLSIIDKKRKDFNINLLSANKNFNIICDQINKYKPNYFVVTDYVIFKKVKKKFKKNKVKLINNFSQKKK
jgi:1-deoxy-D-xylulose-5-phosphate reductoisomerase